MSTEDQKLIDDQNNVVNTIRLYKNITLISTAGDPANEYDIEYKVRGYTVDSSGNVKISKQHRIKIKLPFGYPHFPPTIKPLTSIFHPEIDDYVVPIANYWEEKKSLADLVIHIGNMICGNFNKNHSPFNSEAADYYRKHKSNLPLDSLKLVADENKKIEKEPIQLNFIKPLLSTLAILAVIITLAGGGLYYYEKLRLDKAQIKLQQSQSLVNELEFNKADKLANRIISDLGKLYILRSQQQQLSGKVDAFLGSKALQEGLKGNVKYGGQFVSLEFVQQMDMLEQFAEKAKKFEEKGDNESAIETYEKALEYAEKNNIDTEGGEIERNFAQLKLSNYIAESEKAHQSKDWDWAIKQHRKVLTFIEANKQYIPEANKITGKISYLLLIDQIALYSKRAMEAENKADLNTALKYYNSLIDLIGKSNAGNNATLKSTLVDSMQKAAVVTEKINIETKKQWLVENYKEIFQLHLPTVFVPTLKSPQAIFVKYDQKNMVFDLSCLEKGTGSVVRLRIFYQYNPETDSWSPYDKEIE